MAPLRSNYERLKICEVFEPLTQAWIYKAAEDCDMTKKISTDLVSHCTGLPNPARIARIASLALIEAMILELLESYKQTATDIIADLSELEDLQKVDR